jgi:hypothetical protein
MTHSSGIWTNLFLHLGRTYISIDPRQQTNTSLNIFCYCGVCVASINNFGTQKTEYRIFRTKRRTGPLGALGICSSDLFWERLEYSLPFPPKRRGLTIRHMISGGNCFVLAVNPQVRSFSENWQGTEGTLKNIVHPPAVHCSNLAAD